ncbi:MAG TPA: hypothetical protein VMU51_12150 [Mycobacteriales bacterium]|nr:hypothetical protein [Mycobacteriales bacterium]
MSETRLATRTVFVLNRGARLCLLLAVLMMAFAGWLLFAPIDIQSREGPMFNCGSAARPPSEVFQRNVCGRLAQGRQIETGFAAGAALITGIGGLFVFGASRRTEEVRVDPADDEDR